MYKLMFMSCVNCCSGPEDDAAEADAELLEYASGRRTAPLPTYFIGGFGRGAERILAELDASSSLQVHTTHICPSISHLCLSVGAERSALAPRGLRRCRAHHYVLG